MVLNELISLFERDTERLKLEIDTYSNEENLWKGALIIREIEFLNFRVKM